MGNRLVATTLAAQDVFAKESDALFQEASAALAADPEIYQAIAVVEVERIKTLMMQAEKAKSE